jgi:hypothetical protein
MRRRAGVRPRRVDRSAFRRAHPIRFDTAGVVWKLRRVVTPRSHRLLRFALALALCAGIPLLPVRGAAVGLAMLMHESTDHAHRVSVQISSSCSDLVLEHHSSHESGVDHTMRPAGTDEPAHGDHVVCLAGAGEGLIPSASPGAATESAVLVVPRFASVPAAREHSATTLRSGSFSLPPRTLETSVLRF